MHGAFTLKIMQKWRVLQYMCTQKGAKFKCGTMDIAYFSNFNDASGDDGFLATVMAPHCTEVGHVFTLGITVYYIYMLLLVSRHQYVSGCFHTRSLVPVASMVDPELQFLNESENKCVTQFKRNPRDNTTDMMELF